MPPARKRPQGLALRIPGRPAIHLAYAVIDFNGTLAADGALLRGVPPRLRLLSRVLDVTVLTADTFGSARRALRGLPVKIGVVKGGREKRRFVKGLGPGSVVAIGNGSNDVPMFRVAALGIAVGGIEGTSCELLKAASVVTRSANDALDLLLKSKRMVATLRR